MNIGQKVEEETIRCHRPDNPGQRNYSPEQTRLMKVIIESDVNTQVMNTSQSDQAELRPALSTLLPPSQHTRICRVSEPGHPEDNMNQRTTRVTTRFCRDPLKIEKFTEIVMRLDEIG